MCIVIVSKKKKLKFSIWILKIFLVLMLLFEHSRVHCAFVDSTNARRTRGVFSCRVCRAFVDLGTALLKINMKNGPGQSKRNFACKNLIWLKLVVGRFFVYQIINIGKKYLMLWKGHNLCSEIIGKVQVKNLFLLDGFFWIALFFAILKLFRFSGCY